VWWGDTPIDVFLSDHPFHDRAEANKRTVPFAGVDLPVLACSDLAVFKVFFDRTKDWADLEEMAAAGTLDTDRVAGILAHYLGVPDHRIDRLRAIP
jgi:hypothetical protein